MAENEESFETSIVEQRDELMVYHISSNANQNPTLRTSYFLKPCLDPDATLTPAPKVQSFSVSSKKPKFRFLCSSHPIKGWKTWVDNLQKTHEPAWREAGIFDAIKCSTYHIGNETELIFKLAERWCPETNTFVFPWGEATVTLEDVYVLGGFSPLGVPVSRSCSSVGENNAKQVENKLRQSYKKLLKIHKNLSHLRWQEHFMGCGKQIEHAAFLSLWLARHVFPSMSSKVVTISVFSLASRVSCGVKFAFGQAVLASIYRDLTLLSKRIVEGVSGHCNDSSALKLLSPMYLVQVWAWERFPSLGSVPRTIIRGETRLARWEDNRDIVDIDRCLDSTRETFRWRPYAMALENWLFPRFYVDLGMWVVVASDEDHNIFARCLVVSKLLGLGCVEWYNPHRVALQFGFDQDIPVSIDKFNASSKLVLLGNQMDLKGLKLYIPPRLHDGDVTYRYTGWWMTRLNLQNEALVGWKRMSTSKKVKKISKICETSNEFGTRDIAEGVTGKPMEIPPLREESSSKNLLQVSDDIVKNCALNMQSALYSPEDASLEEDEEIEVNKSTVTEMNCVRNMQTALNPQAGTSIEKDEGDKVNISTVIGMTCRLIRQSELNSLDDTSLKEVEENEANNHTLAVCGEHYDCSYSLNEAVNEAKTLAEHEINIPCSKSADIDRNRGIDEDGVMKFRCASAPCNDALCSYCAMKHRNLAGEARQVMVISPMTRAEDGSEKSLTGHDVEMVENSNYLEVDNPQTEAPHEALCQIKTPTEFKGTSIRVACEDEQHETLCDDTFKTHDNIPVKSQMSVSDDEDDCYNNMFERIFLEFESRIGKLEKEVSA